MLRAAVGTICTLGLLTAQAGPDPWVVYAGRGDGPGAGAHVVFVTGDEEYRSEQGMPQLARILARLGCRCTVLFAVAADGTIDPGVRDRIPGLAALRDADLMVLFTRFRDLPDADMQHIVDYVEAGRPIVALRTATHAFAPAATRRFAHWGWDSRQWDGGFGRQVLGETWVAHHGAHGTQSARGDVVAAQREHPIVRGIAPGSIWDPADVYAVRLPLPAGCTSIVQGIVLDGMAPDSPPAQPIVDAATGARQDPNDPAMPLAWTRLWRAPNGVDARVFTTTLGSAEAFRHEGSRRLLVNACLWALGREAAITAALDVSLAGEFAPTRFGFGTHRGGVRPADLAWRDEPAPAAK
ncbi:MAG: ThuA domain-containing protein [Planctomycetes bacterium]|nr:ThuA domain-containing protein [Planctomycetota bacterium]